MSMNISYKTAGPDIVFEQFDGDLVVLNLATGQYFGFNPSAAAIWSALMAGATPQQVQSSGHSAPELGQFVDRLVALGLMVADPDATSSWHDDMRQQLAADLTPPTVDVYEDLADLIVADPIHDVDQKTGWPNMPHSAP